MVVSLQQNLRFLRITEVLVNCFVCIHFAFGNSTIYCVNNIREVIQLRTLWRSKLMQLICSEDISVINLCSVVG